LAPALSSLRRVGSVSIRTFVLVKQAQLGVRILLYMCAHITAVCVSSCCYISSVLMLLDVSAYCRWQTCESLLAIDPREQLHAICFSPDTANAKEFSDGLAVKESRELALHELLQVLSLLALLVLQVLLRLLALLTTRRSKRPASSRSTNCSRLD
jgi:hypothetical protein